ncbi:MAG TPA: phosphate regulon transcriptional regulator PhoB [Candidatus Thiothrix moscowensis]|uniref:phosphate regulon transcriptional regulator PhoB n=1 Tax=unclassified Thiothrix TaxID=2636184 RepID=UPI001A25DB44|nr:MULTISPECIES: phosphate regulon transcriptional regulator PhoB [unclassified Thiothrix]MBJ6610056.1 phosphate regulon transcriptional regulator PhoB [Candidatus Thiothrix moscowensis]HRJ54333.1 phosphate regulon transcriptional regulator PhoB [Candidatus Thiothrix moscowensis]HRJ94592.1 phosphate regulon transcriptional regulator PhoB [Candidatus Thiothrix moscowensis]
MSTILIVDDEQPIRSMVGFALGRAGFELREAADAEQAYAEIDRQRPELILMDWMLPGASGLDIVRRLQRNAETQDIPVIMLTARTEESDKINGFSAGVDDYISKPFSPAELIARIQAVLRRSRNTQPAESLEFAGLALDPLSHRVTANGVELEFGPTEFRLLKFFMQHPDRVYTREQLLDNAWGRNVYVEERTVDVHILRLRKALAPHGCDHYIQTVRGAGYRFSPTA